MVSAFSRLSRFIDFRKSPLPRRLVFLLLFAMFDFNIFQIADPAWFNIFLNDAQMTVLGRLTASRYEGLTSHGGMLGHYAEKDKNDAPELSLQIHSYLSGAPALRWVPYPPQIGLQGMVLGLIDRLLPLNDWNFLFFYMFVAAFSAAAVTSVIAWIATEIGVAGALGVVAGLFYSPWFVVYGRNLYMVFGTYFLPMLATCWGFHRLYHHKAARLANVMLVLFAAFFIRCACGYEHFTTIAMMAWVPAVFYACRDRWSMRRFVNITLLMGALSVAAFLVAFLINIALLSIAQDSGFVAAFKAIVSHAEIRLGTPLLAANHYIDQSLAETPQSLHARIWPVINVYLSGYLEGPKISEMELAWPPTFADAILLALFLSLFVVAMAGQAKTIPPVLRRMMALVAALWASFFATLSWHVIARQHSFIHTHINFILWYLPFMLLLYALMGEIVGAAGHRLLFSPPAEKPVKAAKRRTAKSRRA